MNYEEIEKQIWEYCNRDCLAMQKGTCPFRLMQGCPKVPEDLQRAYLEMVHTHND